MKKYFISFALLTCISIQAQNSLSSVQTDLDFMLKGAHAALKTEDVEGSAYLEDEYFSAVLAEDNVKLNFRYNIYNDEFEIKKHPRDLEFYILPKNDRYKMIIKSDGGSKIGLYNYVAQNNETVNGYLFTIYENKNTALLRRERMSIKKVKSGYGNEAGDKKKFIKNVPEFYILENEIVKKFPKNKKDFIALYPEKQSEIESFLKSNKIGFGNNEDMIKVINFISK